MASAGLLFGILSFITLVIGMLSSVNAFLYIGICAGIFGLILSMTAQKKGKNKKTDAGMVCSILGILLSIIMLANLPESSNKSSSTKSESSKASVTTEETTAAKPTKDMAGNDITVPEKVNKIVSMSPSTTRLLVDLGLSDKIVACDTYSYSYYGDSLSKDVSQFDMMSPDNEAIVALDPDIVFTTGMSYSGGTDVYASVRESDICLADLPTAASLSEIEKDIQFVGDCTGSSDDAEKIVKEMKDSLKEISKLSSKITDQKTVLYETSTPTADSPAIYSAGTGTYIDEALSLIGAKNVAANGDQWPALTEEAAIGLNPDVIITTDTYTENVVDTLKSLAGWENVTAIKNNDVYLLTDSNEMNQPNQHVVSGIIEMAKDIYPDVYGDLKDPFSK
jgi:iron complex transport system substrate-binding protein